MDWVRAGLECGGYLIQHDSNGGVIERGWVHSALAKLIRQQGFEAEPRALALDEFPARLLAQNLIIASVSFQVGTDLPITRKGGHLVVVTGADRSEGRLERLYVHNPSGRTAGMRVDAPIPAARFEAGYSGRVILVSRS
jgi:hypothetical protein